MNISQRAPAQTRCFPLFIWPSRIGGFQDMTPNFAVGEFDVLSSPSTETDYIVTIRVRADAPPFSPGTYFTQVMVFGTHTRS